MGIQHSATIVASLTPLGDACSRKDLTAIHEVLESIGYKDDEGVEVLIHCYIPFSFISSNIVFFNNFFISYGC